MSGDAAKAALERAAIRQQWQEDFHLGARSAFLQTGNYPDGFHRWPLQRRNAWWAGFNLGRCTRIARETGDS
jgi:hypothetical protein